MKTITLERYGKKHPMCFNTAKYAENGNLYVGLTTMIEGWPEPWSNLTVNLSVKCKENCAFIDTNNNGNEIITWLEENNLGETTGRIAFSGWCVYPEFEFNMEELMKHVVSDERIVVEEQK
jgi:hypothetical protein